MVHIGHYFFLSCCGVVLILFLRDDCGSGGTIKKKNVCSSQNSNNLQFPASAHKGMEDAQVGDGELQATTDRNVVARTAAMTIQVDLGSLRPARIPWGEKSRVPQNRAEITSRVS